MLVKLSAIICTHNPRADYLQRTLEGLRRQTLPHDQWELLLVDNLSREPVAKSFDVSWQPLARHVVAPELGLTQARICGIASACGDLLVFVDDDNLLEPDYLATATSLSAQYPFIGAFGAGVLQPEFETLPGPEVVALLPRLALRTASQSRWTNVITDYDSTPWGAGLIVTRETGRKFIELMNHLGISDILGRRGAILTSGEDGIFTWAAAALGMGFGIFTELRLTHLISARRLTHNYLLRLVRDTTFSDWVMENALFGTQPRPIRISTCLRLIAQARRGPFAFQCRLAALRGEFEARKYLRQGPRTPFSPTRGIPENVAHARP